MSEIKKDFGNKFDGEKVRTDLLSVESILGTAEILTMGAKKYGDRNWEKGLSFSRCYGAVLRHIFAWYLGEDLDLESGKNHLDHAACEIMFLQHFVKTQTGNDDRPKNENK